MCSREQKRLVSKHKRILLHHTNHMKRLNTLASDQWSLTGHPPAMTHLNYMGFWYLWNALHHYEPMFRGQQYFNSHPLPLPWPSCRHLWVLLCLQCNLPLFYNLNPLPTTPQHPPPPHPTINLETEIVEFNQIKRQWPIIYRVRTIN